MQQRLALDSPFGEIYENVIGLRVGGRALDRNKVTYGELTRSELTGTKTSRQSLERSFIKGRNEMRAMVGDGQGTPSESSLYMPTPSSLPEECQTNP